MDHAVVSGTRCVSCHNGQFASEGTQGGAMGTPTGHVAIGSQDCTACHTAAGTKTFTSWSGGTFSHSGDRKSGSAGMSRPIS